MAVTSGLPADGNSRPLQMDQVRRLIVGLEREVPTLDGSTRRYVNLDNAATTPPLSGVLDAIQEFAPWYSSVHRGSGYKSHLSTDLFEHCHTQVARMVGADPAHDAVIFCGNTTHAINIVAGRMRQTPEAIVLNTVMEHHSNLLPWLLNSQVAHVEIDPDSGALDMADFERKLASRRGRMRLVAVSGASNVTGHMPPLRRIARLAHEAGALVLVDGAQLIPHRPLMMGDPSDPERIDFLCFSGHKMYAPFGSGVLIGPRAFFEDGPPALTGGGAVRLVMLDKLIWAPAPDREEPGTPNVLGVLALTRAMEILEQLGAEAIASHEESLTRRLLERLARIDGVRIYGDSDPAQAASRIGVVSITTRKISHGLLAAILGHEHAIGVRNGCFCAHPYITRLLGLDDVKVSELASRIRAGGDPELPGMVRISPGLYNTLEEIELFCDAIEQILSDGPRGQYHWDAARGEYLPEGHDSPSMQAGMIIG